MSNYQQRDNTGSLFKNEDKQSDNHPDYKGSCLVGGVDYWFDAWIKTAESGRRWMSFSFKPKDQQNAPQRHQGQRNQPRQAQPARTHGQRHGGPQNRENQHSQTGGNYGFYDIDDGSVPF